MSLNQTNIANNFLKSFGILGEMCELENKVICPHGTSVMKRRRKPFWFIEVLTLWGVRLADGLKTC